MAVHLLWTVIGIFEDQGKAKQALDDLREAGFSDEQLGFVYRDGVPIVSRSEVEAEENTGAFKGGIVGGILGAADALLTPVLGPSVANTIPPTVMPVAEEAIERVQTGGETGGQSARTENEHPESVNNETEQDTMKMPPIKLASADVVEQDTVKMSPVSPAMQDEIERTPTETLVGEQAVQEEQEARETQETSPAAKRLYEEEATGALTGGVVGGVLGAAVALLIPVLGPAFAGGILLTVFSAALGAVTGGFLGAFIAMGVPEEQAHRYEQEFRAGRTIITVKTEDRQQDALDILYRNDASYANAHDIMHAPV